MVQSLHYRYLTIKAESRGAPRNAEQLDQERGGKVGVGKFVPAGRGLLHGGVHCRLCTARYAGDCITVYPSSFLYSSRVYRAVYPSGNLGRLVFAASRIGIAPF